MNSRLDSRKEMLNLWNQACARLENLIPEESYLAYLAPLQLGQWKNTGNSVEVLLFAPNDMTRLIARGYAREIEAAFHAVEPTLLFSVELTVDSSQTTSFQSSPSDSLLDPLRPMDLRSRPREALEKGHSEKTQFISFPGPKDVSFVAQVDPGFHFGNFVVGPSNQFAHAAAVAVAEKPASAYNPLVLYSNPGLGKTHLLHAIGNFILDRAPHLRVGFFTAENYVNDFVSSIQKNQMMDFRNRYRNFDVLLVDDVQFLGSKDRSQEEFFHTFNALIGSRKQIVLTSDKHPREIIQLEERLRSRFEAGLISDIKPPEIETRIAILKNKAERDDLYLQDEIATLIATHVKTNVRELEGTLTRLKAQASLTGAEITLELAKQVLGPLGEDASQVTPDLILVRVCQAFGLKRSEVLSVSREKRVVLPRQIAMYLMKKYNHLPFKSIGQHFGNKDHSTVMSAVKKIETGIESDTEIREAVDRVQALL